MNTNAAIRYFYNYSSFVFFFFFFFETEILAVTWKFQLDMRKPKFEFYLPFVKPSQARVISFSQISILAENWHNSYTSNSYYALCDWE